MSQRSTVWVFHGDDAHFASGVFVSREQGLDWARRHEVTGVLTEYPVGDGCYDVAVADGVFRPTRPHHATPRHVAGFSPGWTGHEHITGGRPG